MKKLLQHGFIYLVLAFLYLPILILAFYSFTDATMIGQVRGFSLDNYVTLFTKDELISMMLGTVLLALGVALLSTILGTLGAIGAFYSKKGIRGTVELLNEIPIVNADVVTGFSVCIFLIVMCHMDKGTFIPLVVAQTALCAPFVYLSITPRLKMMDHSLYEAALDLGCKPRQALMKVVIPQIRPGIVSGFMTAITLSLDDYFIATYTKPATFDTISTYVVNATRGSQTEIKTALWALSAILFIVVVGSVVYMNISASRKGEERA
ncbi:MAG: ABC transporter permease subunit [Lachnospiraceae bacterium]|nr:ABC transporter permease subunit [Candidatus Merdinaster equi]